LAKTCGFGLDPYLHLHHIEPCSGQYGINLITLRTSEVIFNKSMIMFYVTDHWFNISPGPAIPR
jgi:hypothetical protein